MALARRGQLRRASQVSERRVTTLDRSPVDDLDLESPDGAPGNRQHHSGLSSCIGSVTRMASADGRDTPRRELPDGLREQLDLGYSFGGLSTFGQRPFLTEPSDLDAWQPDVAIVGAPFDNSTSNRPGARFGPRAIRTQAYEPGTYHMDLDIEIFDWLEVVDFGDAYCPHADTATSHANIKTRVKEVASRGIVPIVLGGDHSITGPAATAVAEGQVME